MIQALIRRIRVDHAVRVISGDQCSVGGKFTKE